MPWRRWASSISCTFAGPRKRCPRRARSPCAGRAPAWACAQVFRHRAGYDVIATEGGHSDFAPLDPIEDALVEAAAQDLYPGLKERVAAGPAIVSLYETLAELEGKPVHRPGRQGDLDARARGQGRAGRGRARPLLPQPGRRRRRPALRHGPSGVVIAGGLGLRLKDHLLQSGFGQRFVAKGRFQGLMSSIPVKLITHPQPGLYGAAAAFAQEHAL